MKYNEWFYNMKLNVTRPMAVVWIGIRVYILQGWFGSVYLLCLLLLLLFTLYFDKLMFAIL
jgi:hypothetical protein